MPPGPKRRGHQNRRINDIRDSSEGKQQKIGKNQNKEHVEEIKRDKFHENAQKCDFERNFPNENEIEIEKDDQENYEKINPSIKKYSKRSVNLNWGRYEEKIEGKEEEIGTDYQLALDCSSSAVSQLRLIDEKSWDEDFLKADSNDFTCIHCDILANALECIPFHNQLDISDEFFMADMLNEFNNNADLQRKTYVSPKSRMIYKGTDLKNDLSLQKKNDVKHIIESLSNCLNSLDEVNLEKKKDTSLNKDSDDDDDDETLDMLLSLSEDKHNKTTNKLVLLSHSENQNAQSKTNIQNVENKTVPAVIMNHGEFVFPSGMLNFENTIIMDIKGFSFPTGMIFIIAVEDPSNFYTYHFYTTSLEHDILKLTPVQKKTINFQRKLHGLNV